jgi:hypothetical protein
MEKLESTTLRLNNKLYGGKIWCYFVITKKIGTFNKRIICSICERHLTLDKISLLIEDSTLHISFILSFSNESQLCKIITRSLCWVRTKDLKVSCFGNSSTTFGSCLALPWACISRTAPSLTLHYMYRIDCRECLDNVTTCHWAKVPWLYHICCCLLKISCLLNTFLDIHICQLAKPHNSPSFLCPIAHKLRGPIQSIMSGYQPVCSCTSAIYSLMNERAAASLPVWGSLSAIYKRQSARSCWVT